MKSTSRLFAFVLAAALVATCAAPAFADPSNPAPTPAEPAAARPASAPPAFRPFIRVGAGPRFGLAGGLADLVFACSGGVALGAWRVGLAADLAVFGSGLAEAAGGVALGLRDGLDAVVGVSYDPATNRADPSLTLRILVLGGAPVEFAAVAGFADPTCFGLRGPAAFADLASRARVGVSISWAWEAKTR